MGDYNFEILKLKKDKINYPYRFFILFSIFLIILFLIIMLVERRDVVISCGRVISNDTGSFNYIVNYKLRSDRIISINGEQIVILNNKDVSNDLYDLINKDIVNKDTKGISFYNSINGTEVKLKFDISRVNNSNIEIINNLLGISNININSGSKDIVYNYEYEGFICK